MMNNVIPFFENIKVKWEIFLRCLSKTPQTKLGKTVKVLSTGYKSTCKSAGIRFQTGFRIDR